MNIWTWRQSPELMARLTKAQNALRTPIDIMTYACWCETEEALRAHVERYEAEVAAKQLRKSRRTQVKPVVAQFVGHHAEGLAIFRGEWR